MVFRPTGLLCEWLKKVFTEDRELALFFFEPCTRNESSWNHLGDIVKRYQVHEKPNFHADQFTDRKSVV